MEMVHVNDTRIRGNSFCGWYKDKMEIVLVVVVVRSGSSSSSLSSLGVRIVQKAGMIQG